jgi:hypothetical protein
MSRYPDYESFWPFYVSQHLNRTCRRLHFAGTSLVLACAVAGALLSSRFWVAMPMAGYGFAWIGHFAFEKNRPATFEYPGWSLRADFRMYRYMLVGKMDAELDRLGLTSSTG